MFVSVAATAGCTGLSASNPSAGRGLAFGFFSGALGDPLPSATTFGTGVFVSLMPVGLCFAVVCLVWGGRASSRLSHHHKPPPRTTMHRTATARTSPRLLDEAAGEPLPRGDEAVPARLPPRPSRIAIGMIPLFLHPATQAARLSASTSTSVFAPVLLRYVTVNVIGGFQASSVFCPSSSVLSFRTEDKGQPTKIS